VTVAINAMKFEEDVMDEPFDDEEQPFILRERFIRQSGELQCTI
jgi:hypothetical protein